MPRSATIMPRPATRLILSLALLSWAGQARAVDFSASAEAAKASFVPIDEAALEAARTRLAESVVAVERRLGPTTSVGAGWLDYLAWGGVQKQLAPGAPFDAAAARETLAKLRSGADGLDRPVFAHAATELERFVAVASFAGVGDQPSVFARQVDRLAELLADAEQVASPQGSYQAERRLLLLTGLSQGDELVGAAREAYGHPNLMVEVRTPMLHRLVARQVNDYGPLTDCILGTSIRGTGATSALLTVDPVPSTGSAQLRFTLAGSTQSRTTGLNGPATIRSVGSTSFHASSVVDLSDQAFRVFPATASARTRTRTTGVSKTGGGIGSGLVERIARKRVAEKHGQADAIASSHAGSRVAARLSEQLTEQIAEARRGYNERVTGQLRSRGAAARRIDFRTTTGGLTVEGVQAAPHQLAAPQSAPAPADSPLAARLHQTAANSLAAAYLDGATLSRTSEAEPAKLDIVLPDWVAEREPEPVPPEVDFRPWSIRFRASRPVSIEFQEDLLVATIHAARIQVGEDNYDGWDLVARFEPAQTDEGWRLLRRGEIEVIPTSFDPAAGRPMASRDVALRNNLAKALNEPEGRLPQEIKIDPIDLTERDGPVDFLRLESIELGDGWLSAGWRAE